MMDKNLPRLQILTFQSRDVWKKLSEKGVYRADLDKCREKRTYEKDINQLGCIPVWGFKPSENRKDFDMKHILNGKDFNRFGCEMSLDREEDLSKFIMIELTKEEGDIYMRD